MWCAQARPRAAGAGFWHRDSESRSALCRSQTGALTGSGPKERVQIPGALRGPSFLALSRGKGGGHFCLKELRGALRGHAASGLGAFPCRSRECRVPIPLPSAVGHGHGPRRLMPPLGSFRPQAWERGEIGAVGAGALWSRKNRFFLSSTRLG